MTLCIACGGESISHALTRNAFEILRCRTCGLGRTRVSGNFNPASYYDESYFQGGVADGYSDYVGSAEMLRLEFRQTLDQILPFCHGGRLLEFGCAYGYFLEEARHHFHRVQGIEYAEAAARACRERGLDVVTGEISSETLRGTYDVVVGLDVIEHVPEPHQTIKLLSSHLAAGGVLVMTTGDWASLLARLMGARWRLMTPPQHLWFFTPSSMRAMLAAAGLKVVSLTHPWKRVPLSLVAYQVQRMLGLKPKKFAALNRLAVPINLGDAMRVIAVKS